MALRIVYKDGEEFACGLTQATKLVADEGWSWTKTDTKPKAVKKKTAKPKKAKVEVDAVELKPATGEDSEVIDLGNINKEN